MWRKNYTRWWYIDSQYTERVKQFFGMQNFTHSCQPIQFNVTVWCSFCLYIHLRFVCHSHKSKTVNRIIFKCMRSVKTISNSYTEPSTTDYKAELQYFHYIIFLDVFKWIKQFIICTICRKIYMYNIITLMEYHHSYGISSKDKPNRLSSYRWSQQYLPFERTAFKLLIDLWLRSNKNTIEFKFNHMSKMHFYSTHWEMRVIPTADNISLWK